MLRWVKKVDVIGDHHDVRFPNRWILTGISSGNMHTVIFFDSLCERDSPFLMKKRTKKRRQQDSNLRPETGTDGGVWTN